MNNITEVGGAEGIKVLSAQREELKLILGFSKYLIGSLGNVYSYQSGVLRKLAPVNNGTEYYQVGITDDAGKRRRKYIHRLVAEAFVPNPDNLPEVDHIDNVRWNNVAGNVRWIDLHTNRRKRKVLR